MYLREALNPACWIYRDSQVLPYHPFMGLLHESRKRGSEETLVWGQVYLWEGETETLLPSGRIAGNTLDKGRVVAGTPCLVA